MEDLKYFIILRSGRNAKKRQEFYSSEEATQRIISGFKFDNDGVCYARLGYIVGQKKGEVEDELKINKKKSLLEFECENEETANKCAAYWKLGVPFPGCKD